MIFKDVVILRVDGEFDSQGENYVLGADVKIPKEMPVFSRPGPDPIIIGTAKNIRKIDTVIVADLHMNELSSIPIEVLRHLKPCVNGFKLAKYEQSLAKVQLKTIELAPYNADDRIKTLINYSFSVEGTVKK